MDRFAYGLPDRQEQPLVLVAKCNCGCGEDIYIGDEAIEHEGDLYIEYRCLLKGIGASWVNVGCE